MNDCKFTGFFVKDPELDHTTKGIPVLNFTLGVKRSYKDKSGELIKEVDYFEFEIWDSAAQTVAEHFRKGDYILVHSYSKNEQWETEDGTRRSKVRYRVTHFEFLPTNA